MTIESGKIYLVGAGPGDPGLVTTRGLELIATADTILYDRLVAAEILTAARPDAELVYVGKEPAKPSMPQGEINALLVAKAKAGNSVVRLKGGDPFVFGRGGEEALAAVEARIPYEVVPGVTAGVAASAYAGIPVTHRGKATAVAFVTGHEDPTKADDDATVDWQALARFPGTLVLYMGVRNLQRISDDLVGGGRDAGEPVTVIERGTTAQQRTVTSTLGELAQGSELSVKPPALIVIGAVGELRERLAWFEAAPLFGVSVTVTRAKAQAGTLAARLRRLGAQVVETPTIKIAPRLGDETVQAAIEGLDLYRIVCLTSVNGVELFFEALANAGLDARALANARVAAIGPGTAAALRKQGLIADIVPDRAVAEGLVEALADEQLDGVAVLLARAAGGRDLLPNFLRERGAEVDDVALYESVAEPLTEERAKIAAASDYVTFTSASTVKFFFESLGSRTRLAEGTKAVSIGPATTAALHDSGVDSVVEAVEHDIDGLVEALVDDADR